MCTTYLCALLADRLREAGSTVEQLFLIRLAPGVEYKTRGNASVAIHTDASPSFAFECARDLVETHAVVADERTQPGLVVAPTSSDIPDDVMTFARQAMHRECSLRRATRLIDDNEYQSTGWAGGRGRIGALAAIGAHEALSEWTYERICYRARERWGTDRAVDRESVFDAADAFYPDVWDTVDRVEETAVCVPHTPGPVLFGIRGDQPEAVSAVAGRIEHEPVERACTFRTNQGTDVHLRAGQIGDLRSDRGYRLEAVVSSAPETRAGGHVFLTVAAPDDREAIRSGGDRSEAPPPESATLTCVAFEPTKRFRDRVRRLRAGDRITVCGEVSEGTLKLEKFAVRELIDHEWVVPDCPDCGRSMKSAGASQGYRCRDCSRAVDGRVKRQLDRSLELGWYEVPPCARRHVAKPLVRGGFDAPAHPER
jgi:tRNA(Ile2)-agmatinylcytidine synthase